MNLNSCPNNKHHYCDSETVNYHHHDLRVANPNKRGLSHLPHCSSLFCCRSRLSIASLTRKQQFECRKHTSWFPSASLIELLLSFSRCLLIIAVAGDAAKIKKNKKERKIFLCLAFAHDMIYVGIWCLDRAFLGASFVPSSSPSIPKSRDGVSIGSRAMKMLLISLLLQNFQSVFL